MFFFIIFAFVFILLIIQLFQYQKIKANAFSKKEVEKAAKEQAQKIKYKDPIISCDYCGCKINTDTDKVCPHCGAPYDKDKEWTNRFNINESIIDEGTNQIIIQRNKKSEEESKKLLKKIHFKIGFLSIFSAIALLCTLYKIERYSVRDVRSDEEVNRYNYEHYEKANYDVVGDGIIFDDDEFKVTVTGFYYQENYDSTEENKSYRTKVEFKVENKSKDNLTLDLECNSINGISTQSPYIYLYDTFKKNTTVTIYEDLGYDVNSNVSEMIIEKIKVTNSKDYQYSSTKNMVKLSTSAENESKLDLNDTKMIFSNDKVDIYAEYISEDDYYTNGYLVYVVNKSDIDVQVNISNFLVNKAEVLDYYQEYNDLPAGYKFKSNVIHSYKDEFKDFKNKNVELNISFKFPSIPSNDFSTGYIDISDLANK